MKYYFVQIPAAYSKAIEILHSLQYHHIDHCIRPVDAKEFAVIIDEENLGLLQKRYPEVKIEGELNEIAVKQQQMVGMGNRFSGDILQAKII